MLKQKFDDLKYAFNTQLKMEDRKYGDFKTLLCHAKQWCTFRAGGLLAEQKAELHDIYKQHKLSIADEILKLDKVYPLNLMWDVIRKHPSKKTSEEHIKRIYNAVLDAELKGPKSIQTAAYIELSKLWWRSYHSQKQLDKEPEYQKLKELRDKVKELLGEPIEDD
jgi:hypothetical protein